MLKQLTLTFSRNSVPSAIISTLSGVRLSTQTKVLTTLNPSSLIALSHLCQVTAKKSVTSSVHVWPVVICSGMRCAVLSLGLMRNMTAFRMVQTSEAGMQRKEDIPRGDLQASSNIQPKMGFRRKAHMRIALPCASACVKPPVPIRVKHIWAIAESRVPGLPHRTAEYHASDVNVLTSSIRSKGIMVSRAKPQAQCPLPSPSK